MKLDVDAIKHYARQAKLNGKKIAQALDTTPKHLSRIYRREACSFRYLGLLCKALNVTPNDLLVYEDED